MPRANYRTDYLADVCAALADYVRAERKLVIDSERDGDLEIRFRVSDPDAFHSLLSMRMAQRPAERLSDNGNHVVICPDN